MAILPFRQLTRPHVITGAVLVTWACAKETPLPDPEVYEPAAGGSGAKPGTGGSSAQPGTGGSVPGTGGSSATGGSGATGGSTVTGGAGGAMSSGGRSAEGGAMSSGGRAENGGTTSTGGSTGVGGANGVGGTNATGGVGATGGSVSTGGASSGGTGAGGRGTGGTGMAGVPNDPNWKPPAMTGFAKLVVLYTNQQKTAMSYNVGMQLQIKNQTDAAYSLGKVTIRYWMSSEPAPMPRLDYSASGLSANMPTFVGNGGNSYVQVSFKTAGTIPVYVDQNSLNNTNISLNIQAQSNTGMFDQGNDWSFDSTASAYKENPKITVYDDGVLIWGCEPSHACAMPDAGGEGGAGGQAP